MGIKADQKSQLQPKYRGVDMHLDRDATKQKNLPSESAAFSFTLYEAQKCAVTLM